MHLVISIMKNAKLCISCQILTGSYKEICLQNPAKGVLSEKLQHCIGLVVTENTVGFVVLPNPEVDSRSPL